MKSGCTLNVTFALILSCRRGAENSLMTCREKLLCLFSLTPTNCYSKTHKFWGMKGERCLLRKVPVSLDYVDRPDDVNTT